MFFISHIIRLTLRHATSHLLVRGLTHFRASADHRNMPMAFPARPALLGQPVRGGGRVKKGFKDRVKKSLIIYLFKVKFNFWVFLFLSLSIVSMAKDFEVNCFFSQLEWDSQNFLNQILTIFVTSRCFYNLQRNS